jgi:hypothetical protein
MTGTCFVCVRIGLLILTVLMAAPTIAAAQDGKVFVYFEPGHQLDRDTGSQIYAGGVGFEQMLERHLAVQVDVAALSYFDAEPSRAFGGIASFGGLFSILPESRYEPFFTGGYSLVFGDDTTNMFNVGGGLRHWFSEERALLVDYRYHQGGKDTLLHQFWTVRIGLVFR